MARLILLILFFLLSLLVVFKAPTNLLWYVSILVSEFSWVFFAIVALLLFFPGAHHKYFLFSLIAGIASLALFSLPTLSAINVSGRMKRMFHSTEPAFSLAKMVTLLPDKKIRYKTFIYNSTNSLTLDFYAAPSHKKKPCIIVVHGGSWAGGDSQQLPELNTTLAKAGYHVASINYRLAPKHTYPAPVYDLQSAISYLRREHANLLIDTANIVLLGRSAGGQIVLSAAYTLNDPGIKGVISFYGPADMVWGYAHPTNPLVLNSRKVMEDYLGGTYQQVPQQYVNSSATNTADHAIPTLLIHGKNDPLVSHLHAERLGKKLDSLGMKHYEVYLPWATHAFDYTLNGPAGQISTWAVMKFLHEIIP